MLLPWHCRSRALVTCLCQHVKRSSCAYCAAGFTCLFALFLRVHQAGHWAPAVLAECALLMALQLMSMSNHDAFIRWRSMLMGGVYTAHSLVSPTWARRGALLLGQQPPGASTWTVCMVCMLCKQGAQMCICFAAQL